MYNIINSAYKAARLMTIKYICSFIYSIHTEKNIYNFLNKISASKCSKQLISIQIGWFLNLDFIFKMEKEKRFVL